MLYLNYLHGQNQKYHICLRSFLQTKHLSILIYIRHKDNSLRSRVATDSRHDTTGESTYNRKQTEQTTTQCT